MGATLTDLDEFFSPGLVLTVLGKVYTVPLPSAQLGLWCQRMAQAAGAISAAATETEMTAAVARVNALPELEGDLSLPQRLLGAAYEQMVADEAPHPYIEFCGATAYIWIIAGEDAAERYWKAGGRPEAVRPANQTARRAAKKTGATRTAAADTTPPRASISGTKSRTTSAGSTKARKKAK